MQITCDFSLLTSIGYLFGFLQQQQWIWTKWKFYYIRGVFMKLNSYFQSRAALQTKINGISVAVVSYDITTSVYVYKSSKIIDFTILLHRRNSPRSLCMKSFSSMFHICQKHSKCIVLNAWDDWRVHHSNETAPEDLSATHTFSLSFCFHIITMGYSASISVSMQHCHTPVNDSVGLSACSLFKLHVFLWSLLDRGKHWSGLCLEICVQNVAAYWRCWMIKSFSVYLF